MNVIFLETDGVLNSVETTYSQELPIENEANLFYNPEFVRHLAALCHCFHAKVVLTGRERLDLNDENLMIVPNPVTNIRMLMQSFDDNDIEVVGKTANTWKSRGEQILEWLEDPINEMDKERDKWLVIDNPIGGGVARSVINKKHILIVDDNYGFTTHAMLEASHKFKAL